MGLIDFKEILDGEEWALFCCDFLREKGLTIESPPDRGPDGNKDMIVCEYVKGVLFKSKFRWLVSCKHFAHRQKNSTVSDKDDYDIPSRVRRYGCDGFIGFYSTSLGSSLTSSLLQSREKGDLKEYELFNGNRIENDLIINKYFELTMRYFPLSHNKIHDTIHPIFENNLPLNCINCSNDILQEINNKEFSPTITYIIEEENKSVIDIYWTCQSICSAKVKQVYKNYPGNLILDEKKISDLVNPSLFLNFIIDTLTQYNSRVYVYTDKAHKQIDKLIKILSQIVFRKMSLLEREEAIKYISSSFKFKD